MTRWKAFASHLGLSLLVIGGIAISAFLLWYPNALHRIAGLDRILLVMLGIDLTAGPLLTLILYKPGKRGLKLDLSAIAFFQLAFLAYGLLTVWQARPVFLVGTPDTFTLVFASEIDDHDLALGAKPEWRRLSWTGPKLVGTRMPTAPEDRRQIIEEFMAGGAGIERSPKYYMDYDRIASEILDASDPVYDTTTIKDSDIRRTGLNRAQLRQIPVISRRGEGIMLIDASNGTPLRTITKEHSR